MSTVVKVLEPKPRMTESGRRPRALESSLELFGAGLPKRK